MFVEIRQNIKALDEAKTLPFIIDSIGYMPNQPAIVRPDGYRCHHILWVTDGSGIFEFDGKTAVLSAGQGVFFSAGFPHSYKPLKNTFGSFWMTFYGLDELLEYYGVKDWFEFNMTEPMYDSFKILRSHCLGSSTVVSRSANGYSLILEFLDFCFAKSVPLCEKVDRYLESNFADDLSLDHIADEVGFNKYTLCKQYLKATGTTVMEQLKYIRVAKAKQYLVNTPCSIELVGKLCGFNSPSYFGKVFRELTGKTPFQYRSKNSVQSRRK